jgi:hypothetical protein
VRHLKPGGRIFFGLNPCYASEYYTPEVLNLFLARGAAVERAFIFFRRSELLPSSNKLAIEVAHRGMFGALNRTGSLTIRRISASPSKSCSLKM